MVLICRFGKSRADSLWIVYYLYVESYLGVLKEVFISHRSATSVRFPLPQPLAFVPGLGQGEEGSINQVTEVNVGVVLTKILKRHPTST